jgi:hypothetical protein
MFNHRKTIMILSFIVLLGLIVIFASVSIPKTAIAQSGDGGNGTSAEQSTTEADQSGASAKMDWEGSAEFADGSMADLQTPPAASFSEPEAVEASLISWRIVGSALRPRENDVSYSISSQGGCIYVTSGDADTVWNIPVNLPQGSTIDILRMYYNDTSDSNSGAWFTIYDLYGNIVTESSVSSSGNAGVGFNDSAQINHTIDYSVYSYLINWRPSVAGSTMQLCGFRIFYEPPPFGINFLPVIEN